MKGTDDTPTHSELPPSPPADDGAGEARVCARCKAPKPLDAYDTLNGVLRKNCRACAAIEAARRKGAKVPKPEGWTAPRAGETPLKRCTGACGESKVWSAFPTNEATVCRACMAGEAPAPKPEPKADAMRPTEYTPALGAAIAERIAAGETLKAITADSAMPSKDTLARWRLEHDDLAAMLATARQARADSRADEIADLVEAVRTGRVDAQAGRVAIDGLRWLASKDAPATYGDRVELSNPDGSLKAVNAAAAIEALLAALPDLGAAKVTELLPSPAPGDGAAEAAGAIGMAPAASPIDREAA